MRNLKHRFSSFLRNEDGLVLVEGLLMLPLVIWAMVAMFIYWDVFRTINVTQKAAYGVADLLSRQRAPMSEEFIDGLQQVMNFLTPGGHPVQLRVTSLEYDESEDKYVRLFSRSPLDKVPELTEAQIQAWKVDKIPLLNDGDSVFVVETRVQFKAQLQTFLAGFLVGVEDANFGNFIVTRPRKRRLCIENDPNCT
jgi:hypothetical protein